MACIVKHSSIIIAFITSSTRKILIGDKFGGWSYLRTVISLFFTIWQGKHDSGSLELEGSEYGEVVFDFDLGATISLEHLLFN